MTSSSNALSKSKVFLAHSIRDSKFAEEVRGFLVGGGIPIWQDTSHMVEDAVIPSPMEEVFRHISYLIVILSPDSLKSGWLREEIRLARQEGILVLVVCEVWKEKPWDCPAYMKDLNRYIWENKKDRDRLKTRLNKRHPGIRAPLMAPPVPAGFIERREETEELKRLLMAASDSPTALSTAVVGAGGFGKTWLAVAVCRDPEIQDRFADGILWVTLSEKSLDWTAKVGSLIYAMTRENPPSAMEAACTRLSGLLHKRNVLIVIDDVWWEDDLQPFLTFGDVTVRLLVTTRNYDAVSKNFIKMDIDVMKKTDSLNMLTFGLPNGKECIESLDRLTDLFGHWPLLISLANGYLRDSLRQKMSLSHAIDMAEKRLKREGVAGFDVRNAKSRDKLASLCLDISMELLSPLERELFLDMAVFPEDIKIPVSIIRRFWQAKQGVDNDHWKELLKKLADISLLHQLDCSTQSVRLHDIIRTYLRTLQKDRLADIQNTFLSIFNVSSLSEFSLEEGYSCQVLENDQKIYLKYIWSHAKHHLQDAGRVNEWYAMLQKVGFIVKRTEILGSTSETLADLKECIGKAHDGVTAEALSWYYEQSAHLMMGCKTWQEMGRLFIQRLWLVLGRDKIEQVAQLKDYLPILVPIQSPPDHPSRDNLERQNKEGHAGWILSCLQLQDGRYVSTSSDKTIKVWSYSTGGSPVVEATLRGHGGNVNACAELPDNRLVTASDDTYLIVWDLGTYTRKETLFFHTQGVNACIVLKDGRLVSASDDEKVRVWDLVDMSNSFTLEEDGHNGGVLACVELDGSRLLTACRDMTLKIWELDKKEVVKTLEGKHSQAVTGCAVLEDGTIVSVDEGGNIVVWGEDVRQIKLSDGKINSCVVIGDYIAVSLDDKECKIINSTTMEEVKTVLGHCGEISCSNTVNGGMLLTGSEDNSIKLWDLKEIKEVAHFAGNLNNSLDCAVLKDGRVISAKADGKLDVWSEVGVHISTHAVHEKWMWGCIELPDGRIATCSADETVKIMSLGGNSVSRVLKGHSDAVWHISMLSESHMTMLSCSEDGTVLVWDIGTGERGEGSLAHEKGVCDCAASNGRPVTASYDHTLRIWGVDEKTGLPTGESISLTNHKDEVWCCCTLSDGRILSGSKDHTLILWSADGEQICQLIGHQECVYGCAATADVSPLLVSSSRDGMFMVWDIHSEPNKEKYSPLATYYAEGQLNYCSVFQDKKHFAVSGSHGMYFLKLIRSENDLV